MNTLRILTLIFHVLIVIGAGHGIGVLGFIEIISMHELFSGNLHFSISGNYDDRLMTVGLISLLGQSILITSFFFDNRVKSVLTIIGSLTMLIGTFILTRDAMDMNIDTISLVFALPFIGTSLILLTRESKKLMH